MKFRSTTDGVTCLSDSVHLNLPPNGFLFNASITFYLQDLQPFVFLLPYFVDVKIDPAYTWSKFKTYENVIHNSYMSAQSKHPDFLAQAVERGV